jgi:hypothetical protein
MRELDQVSPNILQLRRVRQVQVGVDVPVGSATRVLFGRAASCGVAVPASDLTGSLLGR